jgi:hypothetical protein
MRGRARSFIVGYDNELLWRIYVMQRRAAICCAAFAIDESMIELQ